MATIKLLEENIGVTLLDINLYNIFLDLSPRVMEIKTKINKWDLIKSFCIAKKTVYKKNTKNLQNGRKYLQMMWITRDSSPKYTNCLIELSVKKQPNQKMGRRSI